MAAKLIVRITPDDHVEVRVQGLTEADQSKPRGKKLCEKITRKLEEDLGVVERRRYDEPVRREVETAAEEQLRLDGRR